jgi:3',5'-cyclic-AMP phosphodiesterase
MPIHLPPISRRRFLAGLGSSIVIPALIEAAPAGIDESLVAILNDTHIGQKQPADSQNPSHLRETVKWLLALDKRPAALLINGDLALLDGQPGDYAAFLELIRPLREAGLTVHLTLGNHDDREVFFEAVRKTDPATPLDEAKHIGVIETKFANLFLLDSLKSVNKAPGELGAAQIEWLTKQLDARPAKPVIIIAHHNPRLGGDPKHFPGGLEDSDALWQVLAPRKHVKAYIHGHIHDWSLASHQDIHIINTPAVSYVANPKTSTTGWTMARVSERSIELTLHTHIADHPWNGERKMLEWRV